jgi:uncharacterized protein YdbL (DUF1318 family)
MSMTPEEASAIGRQAGLASAAAYQRRQEQARADCPRVMDAVVAYLCATTQSVELTHILFIHLMRRRSASWRTLAELLEWTVDAVKALARKVPEGTVLHILHAIEREMGKGEQKA